MVFSSPFVTQGSPHRPQNALLSDFHKSPEFMELARGLHELDICLWGSEGTVKALAKEGIPCKDVAVLCGPPILGHKVVTLSKEVCAGYLADGTSAQEMAELATLGIPFFDIVYFGPYPLGEAITNPDATRESVQAKTDIGAMTARAACAKMRRLILCIAEQFPEALRRIQKNEVDILYLDRLARTAYRGVSSYYSSAADAAEKFQEKT